MSSSGFGAARHWCWLVIISAAILSSSLSCKRTRSADSEEKKVTVLDPRGQPSGVFGRRGEPNSHMMAIFDPETHPTISRDELVPLRMASRLNTLENKKIYLVDVKFEGSRAFLEELQAWFSKNIPSAKTVLVSKSGTPFSDSPELWAEIKKEGDAVIFGVGG